MIFEKWKPEFLQDDFSPFPSYGSKTWHKLPEEVKAHYLAGAEHLKDLKWKSLPANLYMDFAKNGNRSRYEKVCFERRRNLFTLMMAECIEGKGQYIDDIINGIWLICEESTWVVPAHNHVYADRVQRELVDIEEPVIIDLFSAETGSLLSWVYYFLGSVIGETAPLVKRRIELEMDRRILKPYLARDDFGWMGLCHDNPVNNWNPWINSNVLVAYLIFADKDMKIKGIEKVIKSTDRFLSFYAEDGGCDEGPGYFGVAGASLLDLLEELDIATNSAVYLHNDEMIKNMARYIYRVYIGGMYYVNFADAHAQVAVSAGLLYRTGKKIGDKNLTGFASYLMENEYTGKWYANPSRGIWCLFRNLSNIFQNYEEKAEFNPPEFFWFEGIQVLTARDKKMFIAAKGGNNNESHNHNDIGNFILYHNSKPIIIDAGVETYSRKTFSPERYSIWTMQSCYHNTPTINGYDQLPGLEMKADAVSFSRNNGISILKMDIKKAYPAEAQIQQYTRKFTFKPGEYFEISDSYALTTCAKPLVVNFLVYNTPVVENGRVSLGEGVSMSYNDAEFTASVEVIEITDGQLLQDWGKESLYRITFTQNENKLSGDFKFVITG